MATLDGSILGVALPTIARELNAPIDLVIWVVLSYSLTLVSLMLVFGAWAGNRGYAFAYKFGYIFFIIGSIICAFSHSIYPLIGGRIVQAIGTSMFQAVGPGMVTEVFPAKERGKGIGMMVMMVAAGLMTGAPLGGLMLTFWSWPSIFLINIPIGLTGLFLTYRYFGKLKTTREKRPIHLGGALAVSVCILSAMLALSFLNDYQFSDPRIWGLAILAIVSGGFFFKNESDPAKALIGLTIFRNRQFMTSIIASQALFISMSGIMILMPFYLENVRSIEPKTVGLFLVTLPISMFVAAPLAGKLSDRIGFRVLTTAGLLSLATGLWLLSYLGLETPYWFVVVSLTFVGLGVGVFNTPNSSALMGSVGPELRAVASGVVGTSRNLGFAIGMALATAILSWFQVAYSSLGSENLIFIASLEKVLYLSVAIALVGIPFCLMRENRVAP